MSDRINQVAHYTNCSKHFSDTSVYDYIIKHAVYCTTMGQISGGETEGDSQEVLNTIRPNNFSAFVRATCLYHSIGLWADEVKALLQKDPEAFGRILACREDIEQLLLDGGCDKSTAFRVRDHLRKGLGMTSEIEALLRQAGANEIFISACKSAEYIVSLERTIIVCQRDYYFAKSEMLKEKYS